jgi:hypothetical protein
LGTDSAQQFKKFTTTKALWDALEEWYEGNEDMKDSRGDMSRQNFNMFKYVRGEALETEICRFSHLVTETRSARIELSNGEVNKKLLNSLPYN